MRLLRRKPKSFDIQVQEMTLHITASPDFAEESRAAALGFWSAEALTLFGGFFWLARRRGYRPKFVLVDGQPVTVEERGSDPGPEAAPSSERIAGVVA